MTLYCGNKSHQKRNVLNKTKMNYNKKNFKTMIKTTLFVNETLHWVRLSKCAIICT